MGFIPFTFPPKWYVVISNAVM